MAWGEVGREMKIADGDSEEAEGWVADGGGHFADLAVAAFLEGEFEPRCGDTLADSDGGIAWWEVGVDLFGLGGEGFVALYDNTGAEFLQGWLGDCAFDLGPVGAGVGLLGVEEFGVEAGFVGEKEEAFAVAV